MVSAQVAEEEDRLDEDIDTGGCFLRVSVAGAAT
jgi:hypothetical protein